MRTNRLFRHAFQRLRSTGFFHIVGSGTLNKVIGFISGIILVRIVDKMEYGAYSYALNIINYFVLLNGLGASSSVVQLCVERGEKGGAAERVYRVACSIGMLWDIFLTCAIVVFALAVPLPVHGANTLLLVLAPFPLLSLIVDFQQQRLRSMLMNREYALATNVSSLSLVAFSVGGALLGSSNGLSIGRSLAMGVSAAIGRAVFRVRVYFFPPRESFSVFVDVIKMSMTVCLTNTISQALVLVGTTAIGALTGSQTEVASYSTATTIPFALDFLPSMMTAYLAPYFITHNTDRDWTLRIGLRCVVLCLIGCWFISLPCIAAADWLVPLLFGSQYTSSVESFQMLMAAFPLNAALSKMAGNILAAHRRYGINCCIAFMRFLVALGATLVLVPLLGCVGAAIGYLLSTLVGAVMNMLALFKYAGKAR